MFYLKIKDEKVIEAPKIQIRNGFQVFGYNKNLKMLKEDGFLPFNFPASKAEIIDGKIVEKEIKTVEKTVFSKLEIRRACRALGLQEKLNLLLDSADQIKSDWLDAQHIDLSDQMFVKAVEFEVFTAEDIQNVKDYLK